MKKLLLSLTIAGIAAIYPAGTSSAADDASSSVTFSSVTVSDATNMSSKPKVTADAPLPSATLKVKDLVVGKGATATPDSTVSVHYVGVRYADGKQFDSSWERGGPTSFPLKRLVKGFTQGIGGNGEISPMKVGGRRIIIIPPEMAYGAAGNAGRRRPARRFDRLRGRPDRGEVALAIALIASRERPEASLDIGAWDLELSAQRISSPSTASTQDVSGRWDFRMVTSSERTARGEFWLFRRGEEFTGTLTVQDRNTLPIRMFTVRGEQIAMTVDTPEGAVTWRAR